MRIHSARPLFIPGALALALLFGCAAEEPAPRDEPAAPVADRANPASEHCETLGGGVVIVKGEAGEVGMCHLPDGTVVEEWEPFRREAGEGGEGDTQADSATAQVPNPASAYCVRLGGRIVLQNSEEGVQSVCHLPDGSAIEEWALFRRDYVTE